MIAPPQMMVPAARSLSRRKERSPAQASLVSIGLYIIKQSPRLSSTFPRGGARRFGLFT